MSRLCQYRNELNDKQDEIRRLYSDLYAARDHLYPKHVVLPQ